MISHKKHHHACTRQTHHSPFNTNPLQSVLIAAMLVTASGFAPAQSLPPADTFKTHRVATVRIESEAQAVVSQANNPEESPLQRAIHAHQQSSTEDAAPEFGKVGSELVRPKTLNYPYGITVDRSGNIYVTNLFGGVNIYDPATLLEKGSITSGLSFPAAVGVNYLGNIYIANNGANNVTVYQPDPPHTLLATINDSTLSSPGSLYVDGSDDIWVLDAYGNLHLYLTDLTPAGSTHSGGTAVGPWGPYVTVWGIGDGTRYDENFQNIGLALHNGPQLPISFLNGSPFTAGETQDQHFNQYVTDLNNKLVQIWNPTGGELIATFPTPSSPYGIAVDDARKRIYVTMTTLNKVYIYSQTSPYQLLGAIQ